MEEGNEMEMSKEQRIIGSHRPIYTHLTAIDRLHDARVVAYVWSNGAWISCLIPLLV